MTESDPTDAPPPPAPQTHHPGSSGPVGPQPMLDVTPGGPVPPWVIWVGVASGVMTVLFTGLYIAFLIWANT